MSPTVFSASQRKQEQKQQELEKQLETLVEKEKPMTEPKPEQKIKSVPASRHPDEYSEVLRALRPTNGIFLSSFIPKPPDMFFESQHEKEKILLVLRQHPVVNLKWIFTAIILMFLPFLVAPLFPFFQFLPERFGFFLTISWFLFILAYVLESFLNWYFNIYILTDERIVDIDFYSLLFKSVAEAKLEKVEDVTSTTAGFLGSLFNFGDVAIQTAAEKREFEFLRVPQPVKVTKLINELILEEEREKIEGRVS